MTSVAEVLERAADLIEPEGAWTQGASARDVDGHSRSYNHPEAVCWCIVGALGKVGSPAPRGPILDALTEVHGCRSQMVFNDAPGRTQSEVVAALRTAARHARTAEEKT